MIDMCKHCERILSDFVAKSLEDGTIAKTYPREKYKGLSEDSWKIHATQMFTMKHSDDFRRECKDIKHLLYGGKYVRYIKLVNGCNKCPHHKFLEYPGGDYEYCLEITTDENDLNVTYPFIPLKCPLLIKKRKKNVK